ncbi:DUF6074 family protein [Methylobacterium sp. WSM2598]|uniref:DUF6074 family protein n=1 Tax=Methylobacterium sp. WSM2598 TaxID=398261 RepID=UPI0012F6D076|nr:DUF6074 family protein [Methylobacterium sp. WSM2598]
MTAIVIPFPRTRNRAFVRKHAWNAATMTSNRAENYLRRQLMTQRETMERRGIDPNIVENEVIALERAIRSELVGFAPCRPGGAA